MKSFSGSAALVILSGFLLLSVLSTESLAATCTPTDPDMLGPFYKPGAPIRSIVGTGYVLKGTVRSAKDCAPVPRAVIECWLAGQGGEYDDAHRATVVADASGSYRFESSAPKPYFGRPPHIHIRVSAVGFRTLVTQHYPEAGKTGGMLDLVLVPLP